MSGERNGSAPGSIRPPVPRPRTIFTASRQQEPTVVVELSGNMTSKDESKHKSTYSKIKGILPVKKPKHQHEDHNCEIIDTRKPNVPPRPKHKKYRHHQYDRKATEWHTRLDVSPARGDVHSATASSVQNKALEGSSFGIVAKDNNCSISAITSKHTMKTDQITNMAELLEAACKARECVQEAKNAFDNGQYNQVKVLRARTILSRSSSRGEASKRFQRSLDLLDIILETPLGNMSLARIDESTAQETIFEMRHLRKEALEKFCDAQCDQSSGCYNKPVDAPPSYNDVIKEDFFHTLYENQAFQQPLIPVTAATPSNNVNFAPVNSSVPPLSPAKLSTSTNFTRQFSTPIHEPLNSNNMTCSFNESIYNTPQSFHHHPQHDSNEVMTSRAVRPKVNPKPLAKKSKHTFPPDVPPRIINQKENRLSPRKAKHDSLNQSLQQDFLSAMSSPNVSATPSQDRSSGHRVEQMTDPFTSLDPFFYKRPENSSYYASFDALIIDNSQNAAKSVESRNNRTDECTPDMLLNPSEDQILAPVTKQDTLKRKGTFSKSVFDLSDLKQSSHKARNLHPLRKTKPISRSNESILKLFDPISATACEMEENDDFMVDKQDENHSTGNANDRSTDSKPMTFDDSSEREETVDSVDTHGVSYLPLLALESSYESTNASVPNERTDKGTTLYPKLSMNEHDVEDSAILLRLPDEDRKITDGAEHRRKGDGLERKRSSRELETKSKHQSKSRRVAHEHQKHSKKIPSPALKPKDKGVHEVQDEAISTVHTENARGASVESDRHGVDALHGNGKDQCNETVTSTVKSTKSSQEVNDEKQKKNSKLKAHWQEIVNVKEGVKLFFLTERGVSSPFNRQSLVLLRNYGGPEGDKARIEVGGELFTRDLQDKNTLVMLDQHGNYVMQSGPGVYLSLVLCSKVQRKDIRALEKIFEIYSNFAKEPQAIRLPEGVEAAAANVKRAVKDKAPGVAKTTSFMKKNSLRAFRKIKAMVTTDATEEKKEELPPEFEPMKRACEQFRLSRQSKKIQYF